MPAAKQQNKNSQKSKPSSSTILNFTKESVSKVVNNHFEEICSDLIQYQNSQKSITLKELINYKDEESGWSFLHQALYFGHIRIAIQLIKYGFQLFSLDSKGRTPLDLISIEVYSSIEEPGMQAVSSWGSGSNFQLGRFVDKLQAKPQRLDSLKRYNVVSVAAAKFASFAVTEEGKVFSWGHNSGAGILGHEDLDLFTGIQIEPRAIRSLRNNQIQQITCGKHHTIAVNQQGEVFAWGSNDFGKLGLGPNAKTSSNPKKIQILKNQYIIQVAASNKHSAAISDQYDVYTWGSNAHQQLGYNVSIQKDQVQYSPRLVESMKDVKILQVSLSKKYTLCLNLNGDLYSWGYGRTLPQKLYVGLTGLIEKELQYHRLDQFDGAASFIAAGYTNSSAIVGNGQVITWLSSDPSIRFNLSKEIKQKQIKNISAGKFRTNLVTKEGDIYFWDVNEFDVELKTCINELQKLSGTLNLNPNKVIEIQQAHKSVKFTQIKSSHGRITYIDIPVFRELNLKRVTQTATGEKHTLALQQFWRQQQTRQLNLINQQKYCESLDPQRNKSKNPLIQQSSLTKQLETSVKNQQNFSNVNSGDQQDLHTSVSQQVNNYSNQQAYGNDNQQQELRTDLNDYDISNNNINNNNNSNNNNNNNNNNSNNVQNPNYADISDQEQNLEDDNIFQMAYDELENQKNEFLDVMSVNSSNNQLDHDLGLNSYQSKGQSPPRQGFQNSFRISKYNMGSYSSQSNFMQQSNSGKLGKNRRSTQRSHSRNLYGNSNDSLAGTSPRTFFGSFEDVYGSSPQNVSLRNYGASPQHQIQIGSRQSQLLKLNPSITNQNQEHNQQKQHIDVGNLRTNSIQQQVEEGGNQGVSKQFAKNRNFPSLKLICQVELAQQAVVPEVVLSMVDLTGFSNMDWLAEYLRDIVVRNLDYIVKEYYDSLQTKDAYALREIEMSYKQLLQKYHKSNQNEIEDLAYQFSSIKPQSAYSQRSDTFLSQDFKNQNQAGTSHQINPQNYQYQQNQKQMREQDDLLFDIEDQSVDNSHHKALSQDQNLKSGSYKQDDGQIGQAQQLPRNVILPQILESSRPTGPQGWRIIEDSRAHNFEASKSKKLKQKHVITPEEQKQQLHQKNNNQYEVGLLNNDRVYGSSFSENEEALLIESQFQNLLSEKSSSKFIQKRLHKDKKKLLKCLQISDEQKVLLSELMLFENQFEFNRYHKYEPADVIKHTTVSACISLLRRGYSTFIIQSILEGQNLNDQLIQFAKQSCRKKQLNQDYKTQSYELQQDLYSKSSTQKTLVSQLQKLDISNHENVDDVITREASRKFQEKLFEHGLSTHNNNNDNRTQQLQSQSDTQNIEVTSSFNNQQQNQQDNQQQDEQQLNQVPEWNDQVNLEDEDAELQRILFEEFSRNLQNRGTSAQRSNAQQKSKSSKKNRNKDKKSKINEQQKPNQIQKGESQIKNEIDDVQGITESSLPKLQQPKSIQRQKIGISPSIQDQTSQNLASTQVGVMNDQNLNNNIDKDVSIQIPTDKQSKQIQETQEKVVQNLDIQNNLPSSSQNNKSKSQDQEEASSSQTKAAWRPLNSNPKQTSTSMLSIIQQQEKTSQDSKNLQQSQIQKHKQPETVVMQDGRISEYQQPKRQLLQEFEASQQQQKQLNKQVAKSKFAWGQVNQPKTNSMELSSQQSSSNITTRESTQTSNVTKNSLSNLSPRKFQSQNKQIKPQMQSQKQGRAQVINSQDYQQKMKLEASKKNQNQQQEKIENSGQIGNQAQNQQEPQHLCDAQKFQNEVLRAISSIDYGQQQNEIPQSLHQLSQEMQKQQSQGKQNLQSQLGRNQTKSSDIKSAQSSQIQTQTPQQSNMQPNPAVNLSKNFPTLQQSIESTQSELLSGKSKGSKSKSKIPQNQFWILPDSNKAQSISQIQNEEIDLNRQQEIERIQQQEIEQRRRQEKERKRQAKKLRQQQITNQRPHSNHRINQQPDTQEQFQIDYNQNQGQDGVFYYDESYYYKQKQVSQEQDLGTNKKIQQSQEKIQGKTAGY